MSRMRLQDNNSQKYLAKPDYTIAYARSAITNQVHVSHFKADCIIIQGSPRC